MTLLRINGDYYFASRWMAQENEDLIQKHSHVRIIEADDEFDHALFALCWHLHSCLEAIEVFSNFSECPVCLCRADKEGNIVHKEPKLLMN